MNNQDLAYVTKSLSDKEKTAAIVWIIIGAIQILCGLTIIAGVWNLIMGIQRLNHSKRVLNPWPSIVQDYDNWLTSIIIGMVLNFIFGGVLFALFGIWDFMTRDFVLKNRAVFENANNNY